MADKIIDEHIYPCTISEKILLDRLARIETETKVRFEERDKAHNLENLATEKTHNLERTATEKEFKLFRDFVDTKFHDLNQLRKEVVEDRTDYFLKETHEFYSESIKKELKDIKAIIDRNSDRLTNIENLGATRLDLHRELDNVKYYHNTDVAPIKEKIIVFDKLNLPQIKEQSDGYTRLVWIGVGIAIAAQVFFHYFFLRQIPSL